MNFLAPVRCLTLSLVLACAGAALAQPLPPPRPSSLGGGQASGAPAATASAEPVAAATAAAAQPKPAGPMTDAEALAKVNAYLNSFTNLQGGFVQFGADGRRYEGTLYLSRPGRIRFEYKPPATLEVIADGTSVAVRDRKLATQDLYTIGQTPLKFLVRERIDLARDVKVTRINTSGELVRVTMEDSSTLGGTSRITLHYDPVANTLRQWTVVDPQGYETTVSVFNLDTQRRPDPKLFVIDYQRVLPDRN